MKILDRLSFEILSSLCFALATASWMLQVFKIAIGMQPSYWLVFASLLLGVVSTIAYKRWEDLPHHKINKEVIK